MGLLRQIHGWESLTSLSPPVISIFLARSGQHQSLLPVWTRLHLHPWHNLLYLGPHSPLPRRVEDPQLEVAIGGVPLYPPVPRLGGV